MEKRLKLHYFLRFGDEEISGDIASLIAEFNPDASFERQLEDVLFMMKKKIMRKMQEEKDEI